MSWKCRIVAMGILALVPSWSMGAEDQTHLGQPDVEDEFDGPVFTDGVPRADHEPMFLVRGQSGYGQDVVARFGWWATETRGSKAKTGEYREFGSSPFWDLDGLLSDAERSLDFFLTGNEHESAQVGLRYFGPRVSADFDYQRFLRRRDHDPLTNFSPQAQAASDPFVRNDLNAGEDFAIRVQELKADFKGKLTKNVKWRLNLWGIRKQGERQVNAVAHCFDPDPPAGFQFTCHLQSQAQRIDWLTMEIEPVVEARFGPVTVEYSRTMRSFSQGDQIVTRDITGIAAPSPLGPDTTYAIVPENFTEIDRLKVGAAVTANNRFYANLFHGNTHNKFRDTFRRFDGFDLRLTNRSLERVTLTGYAKSFKENGEMPTTLLADGTEPDFSAIRHPVDRTYTTAGMKGRWRPFGRGYALGGLRFSGGYEYRLIDRDYVDYDLELMAPPATFFQSNTISNLLHVGTSMRWSPCLDSFVRFKTRSIDYPLLGVRRKDRSSLSSALNTSLPEHEDLIEIGGTWTPSSAFLLSASFGIEKRHNDSAYVNFDEDDYPIVVTAWYAPTYKWSVSAGYASYTNWINQDITLGDSTPFTSRWNYGGRSNVVNVGAAYAWTERLTLTGSVEFVESRNGFGTPPSPNPGVVDYSDLPLLSDVVVETTRLTAGVDYWLRDGISCYFYYNYFSYDDLAGGVNSGTANMFLGGLSATY